jgi:membrane fusion protein (multidrug efflux system)
MTSPAKQKRTRLFMRFGLALLLAAAGYATYYALVGAHHVTTENAYVNAEIAQVAPSTGGTIKDIHFNDTQRVEAGDILVEIDPTDAGLALARAKADLAKADVELQRTTIDYQRRQALIKSGSVSGEELSNSDTSLRAAQAGYDAARVAVEQAQVDLDRTVVKSPISGIVARRQVQLGQRVIAGTTFMSIVPVDRLHVDANFKEVQLRKVRIGQPVELTADLYGSGIVYHGKVAGIAGGTGSAFAVIPAQNATGNWIKVVQRLPVRIALDAQELKDHPLNVGLSMHADIHIAESTD